MEALNTFAYYHHFRTPHLYARLNTVKEWMLNKSLDDDSTFRTGSVHTSVA